jgi:excisionase family DNA binding protein
MVRTEQAAAILDVKKSTMEAWRCRGGGPPFVRYGRAIRYREEDLDRFIESKVRSNTSENPTTPEAVRC